MNQQKTGRFLKEIRQEKGITQEQAAEKFGVAGRTVSRWETGSNMPDLSMLVEIAVFYNVDVSEIIDCDCLHLKIRVVVAYKIPVRRVRD